MVHFQFTNGGGKLIFKEYHFLLRWLFCKINMFFCQARIPLSRMHLVLFAILKIIIGISWEKFIVMPCAGGNGVCHPPPAPPPRDCVVIVKKPHHCHTGEGRYPEHAENTGFPRVRHGAGSKSRFARTE